MKAGTTNSMKCDVCENEATVFLTQIINGQMTTVNLCETCSKAKGVTEETGFGLAEAFLSPSQRSESDVMEVVCPACGFTASQLKKIGRMGCPECYAAFRDGLDALLRNMHKGTKHVGKRPTHVSAVSPQIMPRQRMNPAPAAPIPPPAPPAAPAAPPPPDLAKLRAELDLAVKEERYEDAARLKSEIESLQPKTSK